MLHCREEFCETLRRWAMERWEMKKWEIMQQAKANASEDPAGAPIGKGGGC